MKRNGIILFLLMNLFLLSPAYASTIPVTAAGQTIYKIISLLTGFWGYAACVAAIMVGGVVMSFVDLQSGAKRVVQALIAAPIIFQGGALIMYFSGYSGAVI